MHGRLHLAGVQCSHTRNPLAACEIGGIGSALIVVQSMEGAYAVQDDYELEENDADMVDQGTPYHWRMRAHALGHGAFHALKVLSRP